MSDALPPLPLDPEQAPPSEPQPRRDPFWGYNDLLVFCGLAVAAMLVGSLCLSLMAALAGTPVGGKPGAGPVLATQAIIYVLTFGGLAALFRVQYDRPFWRSLGWKEMGTPFSRAVALGAATSIAVVVLGVAIRTPASDNPMTDLMRSPFSLALMAVFGITIFPLCEELAFRGFVQPLLARSFGAVAAILIQAIPFGLLHYEEYGNSWRHALMVSAAGAAFGWMRHATGSTKASTVMHGAYNAMFFAAELARRYGAGR